MDLVYVAAKGTVSETVTQELGDHLQRLLNSNLVKHTQPVLRIERTLHASDTSR